ncbi:hypothetical protein P8452_15139 [Trifolium repens]|nr:hypothetical protein P8452_15139 [Trifolium repens]
MCSQTQQRAHDCNEVKALLHPLLQILKSYNCRSGSWSLNCHIWPCNFSFGDICDSNKVVASNFCLPCSSIFTSIGIEVSDFTDGNVGTKCCW